MIGLHEGEPFQGNYGFADGNGEITFSDPALEGPQIVTAGADGYEFYTFADVDASEITIPLKAKNIVVPTSQVTGSLSNFSGVNCDNLMQMALVIPPISLESLIGFNIAGQLTENVPVDIFGTIVYLPGNLVIPTQKELPTLPGMCWLLGVNISKPSYLLYLPTGTTQNIFSFGLQADIDDLLGGNFDISSMTPLKVGISRNVVISGNMTVNVNMTHSLTSNLTLAVANAPSGTTVLLASLGEINGNPAYAPGVGELVLLGFGQVAGGGAGAGGAHYCRQDVPIRRYAVPGSRDSEFSRRVGLERCNRSARQKQLHTAGDPIALHLLVACPAGSCGGQLFELFEHLPARHKPAAGSEYLGDLTRYHCA